MYLFVKYLHILTAGLSVVLLTLRFRLSFTDSNLKQHRLLKVFPHINDTFLLLSGLALVLITHFVPFTPAAPWLTQKLIYIVMYILLGVFALNKANGKVIKIFTFLGAIAWFAMAAFVSVTKLLPFTL